MTEQIPRLGIFRIAVKPFLQALAPTAQAINLGSFV